MLQGTFAGRLGRDAELRSTPAGKSVCGFSVAVDKRNGQDKTTVWIDATLWEKRAEALAKHLTKGTAVVIMGDLGIRQYQGKDGSEKAVMTCTVREITLLGGGSRDEPAQAGYDAMRARDQQSKPVQSAPATGPSGADFDDEIPF